MTSGGRDAEFPGARIIVLTAYEGDAHGMDVEDRYPIVAGICGHRRVLDIAGRQMARR
jgi:hypothetical protein